MTTDAFPTRAAVGGGVTFPRVLRSEWTKLVSLRSTRYSLLAAVATMILLALAIALAQMGRWNSMSLIDQLRYDSIDNAVGGMSSKTVWPVPDTGSRIVNRFGLVETRIMRSSAAL